MRGIRRAMVLALLVTVLFVESGGAKGKKKKMMRKSSAKQAAASAGWEKNSDDGAAAPAPPLPTASGWAHGDTTTPVNEIFMTGMALVNKQEYMLAAEGFGQVLRIMPENAIARINFASTLDKAGHPSLAVSHFEQLLDAGNVDGRTQATARHRYGVLQINEATAMCTDKDRSAERDSPACLSDKESRLEKGVKYLLLLQAQATSEDSVGVKSILF